MSLHSVEGHRPRSIPQGSGVGVSVLLGKPGCFEGLIPFGEDLEPRRLAVTHCPKVSSSPFHERGASHRSGTLQEENNYLAIAFEEGFRLDSHRLEGAEEILEGAPRSLHAADHPGVQTSTGDLQLEVAIRH